MPCTFGRRFCCAALVCAVFAFGAVAEYKTEFRTAAEARAAGWEAKPGKAGKVNAPELTVVTDAAVGKTALRIEAQHKGIYQGVRLTDVIDLSRYSAMEFYIKQNIHTTGQPWSIAVQVFFEGRGYALAWPLMGLGKWTKVVLPLRCPPWEIEQTTGGFRKTRHLNFGLRGFRLPGQFIQIDGLRFIPRKEGEPVHGITYTYAPTPDKGDPERRILLDGEVSKDRQAVFGPYGADPVITFDLSEVQTLTRVTLKAVAVPAKNVSSATISVSEDGKKWQPAGSITNSQREQRETEQTLSTACLAVGRYVRIAFKRQVADDAIVLSEVILQRRVTRPADRELKPIVYFQGPRMPPIPADFAENADYTFLRGRKLIVAVHRKTGIVGGIWTAGKRPVVLRAWDKYVLENRETLKESSEYDDTARRISRDGEALVIECANGSVPGVLIQKEYRLNSDERDEWLEKVTRFTYTGERSDQFVALLSCMALDEQFRKGGFYEGVQGRPARLAADGVFFKEVTPRTTAMMLIRRGTRETLTQYRHKVNGQFVRTCGGGASETYCNSAYTRTGWEIGQCVMKLSGQTPSVQVHTALLADGRFGWERHYVSLPAVRADLAGIRRPEWLSEVKANLDCGYSGLLKGMKEWSARRILSVIDDGYVLSMSNEWLDGVWGHLPVEGEAIGLYGGVLPVKDIVRTLRKVQENPRYKIAIYKWPGSANPEAPVFQEHPEWFVRTDREGAVKKFYPAHKLDFARCLSAPGHIEFLVDQVAAFHKRYPQSLSYFDGGSAGINQIEWERLRVDQDYHWQEFYTKVRERLQRLQPGIAIFCNSALNPAADIGYSELGREFGLFWRRAASRMYPVKVRQYFDQDRLLAPLYMGGTGHLYLRTCTALGLLAAGAPRGGDLREETLLGYAPYCSACFEMRGVQLSPTRIEPDWRDDPDTEIEMYSLRPAGGWVLSVVNHKKEAVAQELRAEVPTDLAGPNETLYVVHHVMKDIGKYKCPVSDFTNKKVYKKTGWATGAVVELRSIIPMGVDGKGWLTLNPSLPPGLLNVFSIVKVPVFYWSRDGLRANFLLQANRKHTITTRTMDSGAQITVSPEKVGREVLVLAPPNHYVQRDVAGGERMALRPVAFAGAFGAILTFPPAPVPTTVSVSFGPYAPGAEPQRISLESGGRLPKGDLLFNIRGPRPTVLYHSVWREGTLVNAGWQEIPAEGQLVWPLQVPAAAQNGEYTLEAGPHPTLMAKAIFSHTSHKRVDRLGPPMPPATHTFKVTPVQMQRDGIAVLNTGIFQRGGCKPNVDLKALTVTAEVPGQPEHYYTSCHAGVEFKGLRRAAVRVEHDIFPVRGLYPEQHTRYPKNPSSFCGFFVDYATAAGYVKRVALSVGLMNVKRKTKQPDWGAAKAPDQYLRLPPTIYTGEKVEGMLDLERWAPPGWDGRAWVSVVTNNLLASRTLTLRFLRLNPPPGSAPPVKGADVALAADTLKEARIKAVRFATPPKIDGTLDDGAWGTSESVAGFHLVGQYGAKSPQKTEFRIGYDDRFIYVGMTAWETEKKGFITARGAAGKPYLDDCIEFLLVPATWGGRFLHIIVNPDGVVHQETAVHLGKEWKKTRMPTRCRATKSPGRFDVEVAVPVGKSGVPAPKSGEVWKAQFMRSRLKPDGLQQFTAWTVTDGYQDSGRFGAVRFE